MKTVQYLNSEQVAFCILCLPELVSKPDMFIYIFSGRWSGVFVVHYRDVYHVPKVICQSVCSVS